ncbi:MAG TPA: hypothetical protein VGO60_09980 [Iamia sp.]|jgi:hypothetical protein|nr:hypothetical protein [Iamia sp.]
MRDLPDDMWIDANGAPTELHRTDGIEVVVHHDDIPEKDRMTVDGIPCTTPLRTLIDLAPELSDDELHRAVEDCLSRRLFTVDEAKARIEEDDMRDRSGARLLEKVLGPGSTH